jgi:hypothetical protein
MKAKRRLMSSQLEFMAEEMTEDEIIQKIKKYHDACDNDIKQMELDTSDYWWNDLNLNTKMLINYENILKIKQSISK